MTDAADLFDDVELVPIDDLYPYGNNPKEHPPEQVDKLVSSIREYGWDVPIVADSDGEIIKGHGRLQAARRLDLERVPVIRRDDLSDAEKRAARIADNRVAESDWDDDLLATEVDLLAEDDFDLGLLGFDEDELEDLLELEAPPELDEGALDEDVENELRVVLVAEDEADADFIGEWAEEHGFEWHVVDQ